MITGGSVVVVEVIIGGISMVVGSVVTLGSSVLAKDLVIAVALDSVIGDSVIVAEFMMGGFSIVV